MKNQIQLSAEMLAKLLNLIGKEEIHLPDSPLGPVSIQVKKLKFGENQISVPLRITALDSREMLLYLKLENGFEFGLDSIENTKIE
jgi:hypothetical protein